MCFPEGFKQPNSGELTQLLLLLSGGEGAIYLLRQVADLKLEFREL